MHRGDNENRVRHAGFYALMDWLAGGDQQWLYATPQHNAYYSHDHGHFFPGGPDWTTAALGQLGANPTQLGVDPQGLSQAELQRLAAALGTLMRRDIDDVMSKLPADWPVSDDELAALAGFIDARRGGAAQRLRNLVP